MTSRARSSFQANLNAYSQDPWKEKGNTVEDLALFGSRNYNSDDILNKLSKILLSWPREVQ